MKEKILKFLSKHAGKPLRKREVARRMGVSDENYRSFRRAVNELISDGSLLRVRGGAILNPSSTDRYCGTLALTAHGYGFVSTEDRSEDIFVGRKNLKGGLNGDTVEVVVLPATRQHRSEGVIIEIISRKTDQFIGTVVMDKGELQLQIEPVSPRRGIVIEGGKRDSLTEGDIVVAKVVDWGAPGSPVITHFVERVGSVDNAEDDMTVVCYEYDLSPEFPARVEKGGRRWSEDHIRAEIPNRTDLRDLVTLTIDPWDARDVDDAVSVSRNKKGNPIVGVHIADVSFFVPEGSELDREARKRGNSVYFAEGTVRMLPDKLSADLCSLLPEVDRLAVSIMTEMDDSLNVVSTKFEQSVVRTDHRFTYRQAQSVLEGEEAPFASELREMNEIARRLADRRHKAGSIDFDIPEPLFRFQNGGIPHEIYPSERLDSHRLVEEFMLLANRRVAEVALRKRKAKDEFIFRIHDEPPADDMERFVGVLRRLKLGGDIPGRLRPADFRNILALVETSPYRDLIEKLALRTMSKAIYSIRNRGHFGLAFRTYTHFTSPIRRYSDILVHRYIKRHFLRDRRIKGLSREAASLVTKEVTEAEIQSLEAERAYIRLKQIRWLSQHIGEKFDAIISGVISTGFFVELENTMVEGFVSNDSLNDDTYVYDELEFAIVGRRYREKYQLGRRVRIRVRSVNLKKRRADFELLES